VRPVAVVVAVGLAVLFGAASARAVPIVSFKCSPDPANCNSWYRTNVSIDWTVVPENAVVGGCRDKTYTTDTAGTNELCTANDGEAEVTVQLRIRVDKTRPLVTGGSPSRAADVNGWYNRPVGITFSGSDQTSGIAACTNVTYGGPDSGAASLAGTCTDNAGNVSLPLNYGLKYDETAPVLSGTAPDYSPSASGWFNRPVHLDIQAADATSGIADCSSLGYGGPDSANVSLSGSCRDLAGNSASKTFGLKYDATPPTVNGAQAARAADVNGWYTRPLPITFNGTDQMSGIDTCTAMTYSGPDSGAASVSGTCRDKANNVSSPLAFPFKYDATAPAVADLNAAAGDRSVALSWRTSADTSSVEVARSPGVGSEPASVVFRGPGTAFVDGSVANGVRYAYEVRVQDPAGNAGSATVSAVPAAPPAPVASGAPPSTPAPAPVAGAAPKGKAAPTPTSGRRRLLAPSTGAVFRLGQPPLLQWTPVRRARYYNVQLFREGRKILSVWPTRASYQLKRRWRYGGEARRLAPAKYRWLVWPGFGPRSKADYGRRMGPSTFEVRRPRAALR
jgi:hypothetical protein